MNKINGYKLLLYLAIIFLVGCLIAAVPALIIKANTHAEGGGPPPSDIYPYPFPYPAPPTPTYYPLITIWPFCKNCPTSTTVASPVPPTSTPKPPTATNVPTGTYPFVASNTPAPSNTPRPTNTLQVYPPPATNTDQPSNTSTPSVKSATPTQPILPSTPTSASVVRHNTATPETLAKTGILSDTDWIAIIYLAVLFSLVFLTARMIRRKL